MLSYTETVMEMYREKDIERWYLGLPFTEDEENEAKVSPLTLLSDEEIECLVLGLPLVAA